MSVGLGLTVLRQGSKHAAHALRRRLLVTLEISNRDHSYVWVLSWLAHRQSLERQGFFGRSPNLSVETAVGGQSAKFKLVSGPGHHWLRYQGAWMQVKRERETKAMNMMSGTPWETLSLTTLSRDTHLLHSLLCDAREHSSREQEGKLTVHTAWGTEWRPLGKPRVKRPLESVVLAEGVAEGIKSDVEEFLRRKSWYSDRGIPYRRGYLLHGPPGSGKSSFIEALAGALSYDISLLSLSNRGMGDDKLAHLLMHVPDRSFILIEDIDAAFNKRVQSSEDGYQSSVTFSGFLNALDGVASGEERIVFLTTNHPERLDPALVRPGRIDMSVKLDDATPTQAGKLFEQFWELDPGHQTARALHDLIARNQSEGKRISMAALQGILIRSLTPEKAMRLCDQEFER